MNTSSLVSMVTDRCRIPLALSAGLLLPVLTANAQPAAPAPAPTAAATPARGGIPNATQAQTTALTAMIATLTNFTSAATAARTELIAAAYAQPANAGGIQTKVEGLRVAEQALANARANAFTAFQTTTNRLAPVQAAAFAANGGAILGGGGNGRQPDPYDFNDHAGYVQIFDGKTLNGWDGHPKFWRVEDGMLVGQSTAENPSGNQYITYRNILAHDLDLKCEIRCDMGRGGSGIQYRSVTDVQWRRNIAANILANTGGTNNQWMSTGPQADYWPAGENVGQFYTENNPMGIGARRGQLLEAFGENGYKKLAGTIGDPVAFKAMIDTEGWTQYHIIARGPVHILILNGQVMAVHIDDDPASVNNQAGYVAIELEALSRVSVKNIWLKKIN